VKLGVLTVPLSHWPLARVVDWLALAGVEAIELGTGNYPGDAHCDPERLLADPSERRRLRELLASRGMIVSALSQHGNPLHPQSEVAESSHRTWRRTVELASELEVPVINASSGCPGDGPDALWPNWVTCSWPEDYLTVLDWQWCERVIPYWREEEEFARRHGVKVAIEMHTGFVVYNPDTLLRLRRETGPNLGANFDPSHLFWQGIDAVDAVDTLAADGAIFHVHAKDTQLHDAVIRRKGVLDTVPHERVGERSWSFRTLGYGHDEKTWRDIVSALRRGGYGYVVSIEHEDPMLDEEDALSKAIELLRSVLPRDAADRPDGFGVQGEGRTQGDPVQPGSRQDSRRNSSE
jgi:sugar phosphate isomerase/epimerase